MDLNKITDVRELKAMAYDQLSAIEIAQGNLRTINQRISEIMAAQNEQDQLKQAKQAKTS